MKIKSILLYVKDLDLSSDFYQKLGFKVDLHDDISVIASLGDFQIQLINKEKAEFKQYSEIDPSIVGIFIYIEADDVDEIYRILISKGLIPATTPKDWTWGNREFVIKDPDGYKFIIYKTINSNKKLLSGTDKLLAKGLAQGFAGGTVMDGVTRAGFNFKSSHFEESGVYHDEWFADRAGAGQEVVKVGDSTYSRVYAGGTISIEELNKLGIDKGQVMTFLKKQMTENSESIRLHTDFTPESEGDWQYSYRVTGTSSQIPLTMGKEVITYKDQLVFEHDFIISPVD